MVTVKGGAIPEVLESIMGEIQALGAKRLVIDPITAIAQAFDEPIEVRAMLHSVFDKIMGQLGLHDPIDLGGPHRLGSDRIGIGGVRGRWPDHPEADAPRG
jgi:hypothetical protein